ncbi:hypothetical protein ACHAXT_008716 [Thalassiosira profunda]
MPSKEQALSSSPYIFSLSTMMVRIVLVAFILFSSNARANIFDDDARADGGPRANPNPPTRSGDFVLVGNPGLTDLTGVHPGIKSVTELTHIPGVYIASCQSCAGRPLIIDGVEKKLRGVPGVRSARQERRASPRGGPAGHSSLRGGDGGGATPREEGPFPPFSSRKLQACTTDQCCSDTLADETEGFGKESGFCSIDWGLRHILGVAMNAPDMSTAHDWWLNFAAQNPRPVKIGVVDSEVNLDHPDFLGVNVVKETGFANNKDTHGSHCFGTMVANRDGSCVTGVLPTTTCGSSGTGPAAPITGVTAYTCTTNYGDSSVLNCINWLILNGVDVSSHSYGFYGNPDDENEPYVQAFTAGTKAGQVMVGASGNNGYTLYLEPGVGRTRDLPTGIRGVIGVAALEALGSPSSFSGVELASYSNESGDCYVRDIESEAGVTAMIDSAVEVSAPGSDVISTIRGNAWDCFGGTSMASPHVAAAIAVVMALGACPSNFGLGTYNAERTVAFKNFLCNHSNPSEDDGATECGGIRLDAMLAAIENPPTGGLDSLCEAPQNHASTLGCIVESGLTSSTDPPTQSPTSSPTHNPTVSPTTNPTESPTTNPTASPTESPNNDPSTKSPTTNPTESPTSNPTESYQRSDSFAHDKPNERACGADGSADNESDSHAYPSLWSSGGPL